MATRKDILSLIHENGLLIHSMIQHKELTSNKLNELIRNENIEEITKYINSNKKVNYSYYKKKFSKIDTLDELLVNKKNKYPHLESIRNIVHMETIIDNIIDEETYKKAINHFYFNEIINKIYKIDSSLKLEYKEYIKEIFKEYYKKVSKQVDNYYISVITK